MLLQHFRVREGSHSRDPAFTELVTALRGECAEFRACWDDHDVVRRTIGKKRVEAVMTTLRAARYISGMANSYSASASHSLSGQEEQVR
jgi:hypothetical protein